MTFTINIILTGNNNMYIDKKMVNVDLLKQKTSKYQMRA